MGFSLDVKAAHKRIVLHPDECGLVCFSLEGQLFFYRVTPFGAVFSAFWWARLGGLILRIFHHLIWLSHAGFSYVDDFLFFMEANMMPLSATLLCIFCQLLEIPISWKKTAMHSSIDYMLLGLASVVCLQGWGFAVLVCVCAGCLQGSGLGCLYNLHFQLAQP